MVNKSDAGTAIPRLLRRLCRQGCIVTMDAMECRKFLARQIRDQGSDHVLGGKSNREKFHMLYARCNAAKDRSHQAERPVS